MSKLERIQIPDAALAVKRLFNERPDAHIIREIKDHIKEGQPTYLWRGHTHTRPAADSVPRYIDDFEIPAKFADLGYLAPCPCCTPNHPKFRTGWIAWFPQEGVIRLIGRYCFARLNRGAHDVALAEFKREKKAREDTAYLLNHLGRVAEVVDTVKEYQYLGEAIDQLRIGLMRALPEGLWRSVKDGVLSTASELQQPFRRNDGSEGSRTIQAFTRYASIDGYRLFDPSLKEFAPRIARLLVRLGEIDFYDPLGHLAAMDEAERHKVASRLDRSLRAAEEIRAALEDARRGCTDPTIATLRNWAAQDNAPVHFYIRRTGLRILVGSDQATTREIRLNPKIDGRIRSLPLAAISGVAEEMA